MVTRRALLVAVLLLTTAACQTDESSSTGVSANSAIGDDEINRYQIEFEGTISVAHTGGLICKVEDGDLVMDFSIDASDGVYQYNAVAPDFDPAATEFPAEFHMSQSGAPGPAGEIHVTFGYGPAPEEYPGVVRAAGRISGEITADDGATTLAGSYACFLQDAAVGG